MKIQEKLRYLEDRWDDRVAKTLDDAELLRYRSNLLGSDLRITNFGGGNTSSKISDTDPLDGTEKSVMWIKGSGGEWPGENGRVQPYLRSQADLVALAAARL